MGVSNENRSEPRSLAFIAAAISLTVLSNNASVQAATIDIVQSKDCAVQVKGLIQPGDLNRLNAAVKSAENASGKSKTDVCLDSPGGNIPEGIRIIERILHMFPTKERIGPTSTIGTVVGSGAECVGICAYIFMAGRYQGDHVTEPARRLHVGGKLAFQITAPAAGGQTVSNDAVEKAYREGVAQVGALVKQNVKAKVEGTAEEYRDPKQPYPKQLLADALASDPSQSLLVSTVAMARRYGIELIGYRPPAQVTSADLQRECIVEATTGVWSNYFGAPIGSGTAAKSPTPGTPVDLQRGQMKRVTFSGFGKKSDQYCMVDLYHSRNHGLLYTVHFNSRPASEFYGEKNHYANGTDYEAVDIELDSVSHPLWLLYPAETQISDMK